MRNKMIILLCTIHFAVLNASEINDNKIYEKIKKYEILDLDKNYLNNLREEATENLDIKRELIIGYYYLSKWNYENSDEKLFKMAVYFLKRASKNNEIESNVYLGYIYLLQYKKGDRMSIYNSIFWYEKAAKLNNDDACYNLACIYSGFVGVKNINYEYAHYWFEKSAENGNFDAMYHLGYMYAHGIGVIQNSQKSNEWYKRGDLKKVTGAK